MEDRLEENSFGSDILETENISKALLDKASEEWLLELHRGTSLVSPSLNEKVRRLIEDGLGQNAIEHASYNASQRIYDSFFSSIFACCGKIFLSEHQIYTNVRQPSRPS